MAACGNCGALSSGNARFCGHCGAELASAPGGAAASDFGPTASVSAVPGSADGYAPVEPKTSGLAIAALVLSLIPVCLNWVGLVLGIVALVRINSRPREMKGRGLAIAAIVVAPIWMVTGILAAIAIPNFIKFQERAKQSEAKANLRSIYTQVLAYQADHEGHSPENLQDLALSLAPHRRYAYFLASDVSQPDVGGPYQLPSSLAGDPDQPGLVVYAVSNLDSDSTLDVWSIDAEGALVHVRDDVMN